MAENLLKNEFAYRGCILYEFLRGKPIFETYKKLCEVMGDKVDYRDFEFWFMRFAKGEMDLNYDKSLEPKNNLHLMDIPIEILESIVDKLDFMERHAVRKVCRYFQTAMDNRVPEITGIDVDIKQFETCISYNLEIVVYKNTSDGCLVEYGERKKEVNGGDHMKLALDDLSIVMKHPKLQLKSFSVTFEALNFTYPNPGQLVHLKPFFESFNHQLHVKYVFIDVFDADLSILSYFKPGTLEHFGLALYKGCKTEILEEIMKLEQWKQAKKLHTNGSGDMPIDNFFHFTRFDVRLINITEADMIKIRDVLMKSDSFVWCVINCSNHVGSNEIQRVFNSNFNLNGVITYKDPDTGNVFEIELIDLNSIQIEKL